MAGSGNPPRPIGATARCHTSCELPETRRAVSEAARHSERATAGSSCGTTSTRVSGSTTVDPRGRSGSSPSFWREQPAAIRDTLVGRVDPLDYIALDELRLSETLLRDVDLTIYDLKKFLSLAVAGNPTILVLFWVPDHMLVVRTGEGDRLRELAPYVVSRQAGHRFPG